MGISRFLSWLSQDSCYLPKLEQGSKTKQKWLLLVSESNGSICTWQKDFSKRIILDYALFFSDANQ